MHARMHVRMHACMHKANPSDTPGVVRILHLNQYIYICVLLYTNTYIYIYITVYMYVFTHACPYTIIQVSIRIWPICILRLHPRLNQHLRFHCKRALHPRMHHFSKHERGINGKQKLESIYMSPVASPQTRHLPTFTTHFLPEPR